MILWRISRHHDLSGIGGQRASGRWHHAGHPVVYLAESPAAALIEVCVHTSANDVPPDFTLLKVEGPARKRAEVRLADLPHDWTVRLQTTRDLGSQWLRSGKSSLLRVPSAIVPETSNFLLNPSHSGAIGYRITAAYSWPFDPRLKT
jgi:RES domain-containing protein